MNRLTGHPETPLNSFNLTFIEELYVNYLRDPSSVPPDWHRYFEQFLQDDGIAATRTGSLVSPSGPRRSGAVRFLPMMRSLPSCRIASICSFATFASAAT